MNLDNPRVNVPIRQCPWIPTRVPVFCSTCLEGSLQAGAEPGPPTPTQGRGRSLGSGLGMPWAKRLGLRAGWRWGQRSGGQSLATPSELERGFLEVMSSLTAEKPSPLCSLPQHVLVPDWLPLPPFSPLCAHPRSRPRAHRSLASRCLLAPASLPRVPPQGACRPAPCTYCSPPGPGPPGWGIPAPPTPWIPAPKVGGLGLSRWA